MVKDKNDQSLGKRYNIEHVKSMWIINPSEFEHDAIIFTLLSVEEVCSVCSHQNKVSREFLANNFSTFYTFALNPLSTKCRVESDKMYEFFMNCVAVNKSDLKILKRRWYKDHRALGMHPDDIPKPNFVEVMLKAEALNDDN